MALKAWQTLVFKCALVSALDTLVWWHGTTESCRKNRYLASLIFYFIFLNQYYSLGSTKTFSIGLPNNLFVVDFVFLWLGYLDLHVLAQPLLLELVFVGVPKTVLCGDAFLAEMVSLASDLNISANINLIKCHIGYIFFFSFCFGFFVCFFPGKGKPCAWQVKRLRHIFFANALSYL